MEFSDKAHLRGVRKTKDGYLVGDVKCAKTGVQQYLAAELGVDGGGVINVYRPPEEVFSTDSLATYVGKPVTDDHPPEEVTSANWKVYAAGDIGEGVLRDGEWVKVPVKLMDAQTVSKVESGKSEVSMGYTAEIDFVDGITPEGVAYQAVQRGIRINHLAIVDRGRAGIGNGFSDKAINWGTSPITKVGDNQVTLKTLIVDGLTVETTEEGLASVHKIADAKHEAVKALNDAKIAHDTAIAAKDAELAKRDAEIDMLKAAKLSDAEIDAKVQARSDLLAKAKSVADADYTGLADSDIKKAAVVAKLGDAAIEGKTEAYIDARFDILAELVDKADPFATAMQDSKPQTKVADNGQSEYEQGILNRSNKRKGA